MRVTVTAFNFCCCCVNPICMYGATAISMGADNNKVKAQTPTLLHIFLYHLSYFTTMNTT